MLGDPWVSPAIWKAWREIFPARWVVTHFLILSVFQSYTEISGVMIGRIRGRV